MTPAEAANFVENFAHEYVQRWEKILDSKAASDKVKAQGWAILQAAAALRKLPDTSTQHEAKADK